MTKNTVPNPFLWQGKPSIVADAFGRVKSRRQMLLDANRTNPRSDVCKSEKTNSEKAPR